MKQVFQRAPVPVLWDTMKKADGSDTLAAVEVLKLDNVLGVFPDAEEPAIEDQDVFLIAEHIRERIRKVYKKNVAVRYIGETYKDFTRGRYFQMEQIV